MPILSITNTRFLEQDRSYDYAVFRASLDQVAAVPVAFYYFTVDGTASASRGDYVSLRTSATIPAGESFVDISARILGDTLIEADETFQLVVIGAPGVTLADGAAALVATGGIIDDDDGIPSGTSGAYGSATPIFGPSAQPGVLPTLDVHDISVIEGNRSYDYANFLITLDRPATADVRVYYYLQGGTASEQAGDYNGSARSVTINAGSQATYVSVSVNGDEALEDNETFDLVLVDIQNAVFAGGASALSATATIIDDDSHSPDQSGGVGGAADQIAGPVSTGVLPTIRVHDASIIEGDSSYTYLRVLVTLDQPAVAPVTLWYYTQDGSASAAQGDYAARANRLDIPAGLESTYVTITINGDQLLEGNENFSVIFNAISNGRFENNAAVLEAQVTLIEDDLGIPDQSPGIGNPATGPAAPASTTPILPVLQIHDVSVTEGARGYEYMRFLVTLDRPASAPVSFSYVTLDGSAGVQSGDYNRTANSASIAAGQQSTYISVSIYGDGNIEGNEDFSLMLYGIANANFVGNVPALIGRGTILDDDSGVVSRPAGLDDPGAGVIGPLPIEGAVRVLPVDVSVIEGNSSYQYHYVPILLSEAARSDVTIRWRTVENGSAIADTDFNDASGTLTLSAGSASGVIRVTVYGDTSIEGDETFQLELSSTANAVFANGESTILSTIRIVGDDGAGTSGASPNFTLSNGTSEGNDQLGGTVFDDVLNGDGGNDTLSGLDGNDTLNGGEGDDLLNGGAGNDILAGEAGSDQLQGHDGQDVLNGGAGNDTLIGGTSENDLRDVIYGGDGDDSIDGGYGNDELRGDAGNDTLAGSYGADTVIGGAGDDVLTGSAWGDDLFGGDGMDFVNGGFGHDRVNGGAGGDRFFHIGVEGHGSDWIQDYIAAQGDVLQFGGTATRDQFQVNFTETANAGVSGVEEAFVIYRPTGQILWALIDGQAQSEINLLLAGTTYDLLG